MRELSDIELTESVTGEAILPREPNGQWLPPIVTSRTVDLDHVMAYVWHDPATGGCHMLSPQDVSIVMRTDAEGSGADHAPGEAAARVAKRDERVELTELVNILFIPSPMTAAERADLLLSSDWLRQHDAEVLAVGAEHLRQLADEREARDPYSAGAWRQSADDLDEWAARPREETAS